MTKVMWYFDMRAREFRAEWPELTEADKAQLKQGISDGTLTY